MSPNTKQTEQYLLAAQARYELVADLLDIREVGGRLVRKYQVVTPARIETK